MRVINTEDLISITAHYSVEKLQALCDERGYVGVIDYYPDADDKLMIDEVVTINHTVLEYITSRTGETFQYYFLRTIDVELLAYVTIMLDQGLFIRTRPHLYYGNSSGEIIREPTGDYLQAEYQKMNYVAERILSMSVERKKTLWVGLVSLANADETLVSLLGLEYMGAVVSGVHAAEGLFADFTVFTCDFINLTASLVTDNRLDVGRVIH